MDTLVSYFGDPTLKANLIAEIGQHEAADAIVKGTYGEMNGQWRGCAIGCSLRSLNRLQQRPDINVRADDHTRFPKELGPPLGCWVDAARAAIAKAEGK